MGGLGAGLVGSIGSSSCLRARRRRRPTLNRFQTATVLGAYAKNEREVGRYFNIPYLTFRRGISIYLASESRFPKGKGLVFSRLGNCIQ